MASITSQQLNERDVLLHVLQCKSNGRSQERFLRISNVNKNNIVDLPATVQKTLDSYASSRGDIEITVLNT
jgi:hypothetical protein